MTSQTTITLYGNVGADPETRTIPGKQVTKEVYDPIIDDLVEREFTTPEREVRTFSIAVSKKDADGKEVTTGDSFHQAVFSLLEVQPT